MWLVAIVLDNADLDAFEKQLFVENISDVFFYRS